MIKNVWKQPFFILGFLFVAGLLAFSLYHYFVMDNFIYENQIMKYADGRLIDKAPFEPSSKYWFGSDRMGADLFYQVVSGAKFTLGIAFVGSLLRVFISFIGGVLLQRSGFVLPFVKGISQSFYYVPAALLMFFLVNPIVRSVQFTFWEKAVFELLIIVLIAVPNTSVLIKEEIALIEREEFIMSAKIMGGSKWRILFKHVMPHLWPKLILIYLQQVIAVLILLAHIGILGLFFGGTIMREYAYEEFIPSSLSNEWSGLLGGYYYQLRLAPWLVFYPVVSFAIVILAFNFMAEGLKRAVMELPGRKIRKEKEAVQEKTAVDHTSFTFLSEKRVG